MDDTLDFKHTIYIKSGEYISSWLLDCVWCSSRLIEVMDEPRQQHKIWFDWILLEIWFQKRGKIIQGKFPWQQNNQRPPHFFYQT